MMSGLFVLTCIFLAFQSSAVGLSSASSMMTDGEKRLINELPGEIKEKDDLRGVKQTLVKHALVKKTLVKHALVKQPLVKKTLVKQPLVKKTLVKKTFVKHTLVKQPFVKKLSLIHI